jgi:inhibitor of cysteine peptidase
MNFIKAMLAILFIAVFLASCTPAAKPTPTTPVSPITPESKPVPTPATPSTSLEFINPEQRISVPVDVTFIITVNANPTTGYTWKETFDNTMLKMVKRYTPANSGIVGAGGVEHFEFQGIRSGETEISLIYWRSFEPNNPPLETKTFKVTIK